MLDILLAIGQLCFRFVFFIIQLIKDLPYVIELLLDLLLALPDIIGWLPSVCISLTVTSISIVIIYKILGREG